MGIKSKELFFDLHNAWTSEETVPLGSTGIVKTVDKGNGKKAHHKWSILVDTGKGFYYWLTANEYEIIPESESVSESEGMMVGELIADLEHCDPTANVCLSLIDNDYTNRSQPRVIMIKDQTDNMNVVFIRDWHD